MEERNTSTYRETLKPWADEFFAVKPQPMSEDMSRCYVNLTVAEINKAELPPQFAEAFLFQVLDKRAQVLGVNMNKYVVATLVCLCKNPAQAVMYVVAMSYKRKSYNMGDLANLFAMGFPSEEDMSRLWGMQKSSKFNIKSQHNFNLCDAVEPLQ